MISCAVHLVLHLLSAATQLLVVDDIGLKNKILNNGNNMNIISQPPSIGTKIPITDIKMVSTGMPVLGNAPANRPVPLETLKPLIECSGIAVGKDGFVVTGPSINGNACVAPGSTGIILNPVAQNKQPPQILAGNPQIISNINQGQQRNIGGSPAAPMRNVNGIQPPRVVMSPVKVFNRVEVLRRVQPNDPRTNQRSNGIIAYNVLGRRSDSRSTANAYDDSESAKLLGRGSLYDGRGRGRPEREPFRPSYSSFKIGKYKPRYDGSGVDSEARRHKRYRDHRRYRRYRRGSASSDFDSSTDDARRTKPNGAKHFGDAGQASSINKELLKLVGKLSELSNKMENDNAPGSTQKPADQNSPKDGGSKKPISPYGSANKDPYDGDSNAPNNGKGSATGSPYSKGDSAGSPQNKGDGSGGPRNKGDGTGSPKNSHASSTTPDGSNGTGNGSPSKSPSPYNDNSSTTDSDPGSTPNNGPTGSGSKSPRNRSKKPKSPSKSKNGNPSKSGSPYIDDPSSSSNSDPQDPNSSDSPSNGANSDKPNHPRHKGARPKSKSSGHKPRAPPKSTNPRKGKHPKSPKSTKPPNDSSTPNNSDVVIGPPFNADDSPASSVQSVKKAPASTLSTMATTTVTTTRGGNVPPSTGTITSENKLTEYAREHNDSIKSADNARRNFLRMKMLESKDRQVQYEQKLQGLKYLYNEHMEKLSRLQEAMRQSRSELISSKSVIEGADIEIGKLKDEIKENTVQTRLEEIEISRLSKQINNEKNKLNMLQEEKTLYNSRADKFMKDKDGNMGKLRGNSSKLLLYARLIADMRRDEGAIKDSISEIEAMRDKEADNQSMLAIEINQYEHDHHGPLFAGYA